MSSQGAADSEKPTVFISHGAWHGPPHFQPLAESFRSLGFPVVCRRHPSNSDDTDFAENSLYDDARALRLGIELLVQQGKRVLVMAHSYGGMVMTEGVTGDLGFGKIKGQRGGVLGLIYVASFMVNAGESLADAMGRQPGERQARPNQKVNDDGSLTFQNGTEIFFHDLDAEGLQAHWQSLLRPMSGKPFFDKLSRTAWHHFPSMYVYCTLDRAIPLKTQKWMVEEAKGSGAQILKEASMETSHSPFLKDPDALARHIAEFAKQCDRKERGEIGSGESLQ